MRNNETVALSSMVAENCGNAIRSENVGSASRSAMMMLLSGIVLSAAGFVVDPLGEISDSVLWYLSQVLVYAGSVWGVGCLIGRWRGGTVAHH